MRRDDKEWSPLMPMITKYSNADLPRDKKPRVFARFKAVLSAKDDATGAEWTAPSTPIVLIYKEWPGQGDVSVTDWRIFDRSKRDDGTFSRSDFQYDPTSDVYHCPTFKTLTTTGTLVNGGTTLLYLARKHDRDSCKLRAQCCPKVPIRKIPRDQHEAARDIARSFVGTVAFEQSGRERKIEMRFAHLKRI